MSVKFSFWVIVRVYLEWSVNHKALDNNEISAVFMNDLFFG